MVFFKTKQEPSPVETSPVIPSGKLTLVITTAFEKGSLDLIIEFKPQHKE